MSDNLPALPDLAALRDHWRLNGWPTASRVIDDAILALASRDAEVARLREALAAIKDACDGQKVWRAMNATHDAYCMEFEWPGDAERWFRHDATPQQRADYHIEESLQYSPTEIRVRSIVAKALAEAGTTGDAP